MMTKQNVFLAQGILDFENFFGEELRRVDIVYSSNDIRQRVSNSLFNVKNKQIVKGVLYFVHQLGFNAGWDFWNLSIETVRGEIYQTKKNFYCSLAEEDKGHVTIGVNGDSKRMYVAFPVSSSCSTALQLV